MLKPMEARSLSDLIELVHQVENAFNGQQLWFRGHAQDDWGLVPGAHRRSPNLESQFTQHFRLHAPSIHTNCPEHKDYISWLPLMQHYGLPTRLLDWTESLVVAAFFAVSNRSAEKNAAIWFLAPGALNEESIGYFIPFLSDSRVIPVVEGAFSGRIDYKNQHAMSVLAPRTDRRMAAQLGNYTIHETREALENHPQASKFLAKVIIPADARTKLMSDLSVVGVRRSLLFPDLSNLANEISELEDFDWGADNLT